MDLGIENQNEFIEGLNPQEHTDKERTYQIVEDENLKDCLFKNIFEYTDKNGKIQNITKFNLCVNYPKGEGLHSGFFVIKNLMPREISQIKQMFGNQSTTWYNKKISVLAIVKPVGDKTFYNWKLTPQK